MIGLIHWPKYSYTKFKDIATTHSNLTFESSYYDILKGFFTNKITMATKSMK